MRKIIRSIIVTLYVLICVFVTTCLLNYNEYNVTVLDNYSLIINDNNMKIDGYKKNALLVLKKDIYDVSYNDKILYYDTYANEISVKKELVTNAEKITDSEYTYTLSNGDLLSSEFLIGSLENTKVYNLAGIILNLLESRWGYLLIIILPMLILFVYEVYSFIKEVRKDKKNGK